MIKNYLKSAWRNIRRHKFISFINIFGLTVGLSCCLLILIYIINEKSYDRYNKNADNIYRVTRVFYAASGAEALHLSSVAPPFAPLLKAAFPDIKEITRVLPTGTTSLKYNDRLFNESNAFFADEHFFDFFSIPFEKGDGQAGLAEPYSIMMTENTAKKYFGDKDPINKMVTLDINKHAFKVTGIFKAFPANSQMHPEILMSFNTLNDSTVYGEKQLHTNFGNNSFYTYLLLPPNYNAGRMQAQLPQFLDNYVHLPGMPGNRKTHQATSLELQKLTDIHLHSHLDDEIEENGDINKVYIFSAIALFILMIACINYMNLSTARSALRAKEIGIRKVVGALRKEIIGQFLSESVLITFIALIFAVLTTLAVLPIVNSISAQGLSAASLYDWKIIVSIILLPFLIGIISGIYPALFMSSFLPVKVLKGVIKTGSGGVSLRKMLVVLQFSVSIILIIATVVVYRQLQYIQNKALGFNKDLLLTMQYDRSLNNKFVAFRSALLQNPDIKEIGRSSRIPSGRLLDEQDAAVLQGGAMQAVKIDLKCITADYGFIPTYGMQMASGRNFSKAFATDTNNYIINETAATALGWSGTQQAVGKDIRYGGVHGKVIGVVKDFHFESLHQKIVPLLFFMPSKNYYNRLSIKINGNTNTAIENIKKVWTAFLPDSPFDFTFLDDKFQQLYQSEHRQGTLFSIFSGIAIFIASLGLFGLSSFVISQRVKEIGVRKVLGANVSQIVVELSKDFLKLVMISAVIAFPVAYYVMSRWLLDFASRVSISWWIFLVAGVMALIIAAVTISFQAIKAAVANPVKSLRSE